MSSLVALVGIFGAMFGCAWLDPLAATAVGLMVAGMGYQVGLESVRALADGNRLREYAWALAAYEHATARGGCAAGLRGV